jgi:hypothetical protein
MESVTLQMLRFIPGTPAAVFIGKLVQNCILEQHLSALQYQLVEPAVYVFHHC